MAPLLLTPLSPSPSPRITRLPSLSRAARRTPYQSSVILLRATASGRWAVRWVYDLGLSNRTRPMVLAAASTVTIHKIGSIVLGSICIAGPFFAETSTCQACLPIRQRELEYILGLAGKKLACNQNQHLSKETTRIGLKPHAARRLFWVVAGWLVIRPAGGREVCADGWTRALQPLSSSGATGGTV